MTHIKKKNPAKNGFPETPRKNSIVSSNYIYDDAILNVPRWSDVNKCGGRLAHGGRL